MVDPRYQRFLMPQQSQDGIGGRDHVTIKVVAVVKPTIQRRHADEIPRMIERHASDREDTRAGRKDEIAKTEGPGQCRDFSMQNADKNAGLDLMIQND